MGIIGRTKCSLLIGYKSDFTEKLGESNSVVPAVMLGAGIATAVIVGGPKLIKGVKKGAHFVKGKINEGLTKLKTKKSEDSEKSNDHVVIDDVEDEKTK